MILLLAINCILSVFLNCVSVYDNTLYSFYLWAADLSITHLNEWLSGCSFSSWILLWLRDVLDDWKVDCYFLIDRADLCPGSRSTGVNRFLDRNGKGLGIDSIKYNK